eukprot:GHVT01104238.1.p1 GENE.GHVT01104238.1~~GHVT01104238.1.p1  ORF type:complete len:315 (-),score=27.31 GHVT01104238.1:1339-2283(-)
MASSGLRLSSRLGRAASSVNRVLRPLSLLATVLGFLLAIAISDVSATPDEGTEHWCTGTEINRIKDDGLDELPQFLETRQKYYDEIRKDYENADVQSVQIYADLCARAKLHPEQYNNLENAYRVHQWQHRAGKKVGLYKEKPYAFKKEHMDKVRKIVDNGYFIKQPIRSLVPDLIKQADTSKMIGAFSVELTTDFLPEITMYQPGLSAFARAADFFRKFRLCVNPTADISDDILAYTEDEFKAVIKSHVKWHNILSNHMDWNAPDSVKDFSFDPVTRKMRINGQFKGFGNEKQKLTAKLSNQFYLALSPPYFQG